MKDATIEIISEVKSHPNADRLDLVKILGFQCVTEKGLYKEGDRIVYIRPDSVLPLENWTEGYRKYSPNRIKSAKLRGEWSEGIVVPMEILPYNLGEFELAMMSGKKLGSTIGILLYHKTLKPRDSFHSVFLKPMKKDLKTLNQIFHLVRKLTLL